jgi:phosphoadenosine phosphosulfate reductase
MANADALIANVATRKIDRIDASPLFSAADAVRLNLLFAAHNTHDMLAALITENLIGRAAIVSSFGAESAVLLHLIGGIDAATPVLFLDTGKHFAQTLAYRDQLMAHIGLNNLNTITPDTAEIAKSDGKGLRWSFDPDGCCAIRKVAPLKAALAGFDAQFTGRKAFQASTRAALPRFEFEDGVLKINPLADWDKDRIAQYMLAHNLPAHPLVEQGYPSIGCAPCTSKVQPGEDPRAGRWRAWDKVECGIHSDVPGVPAQDFAQGLDCANDPIF